MYLALDDGCIVFMGLLTEFRIGLRINRIRVGRTRPAADILICLDHAIKLKQGKEMKVVVVPR